MRDETDAWLAPLVEAAIERGIDTNDLLKQATFPAAEATGLVHDLFSKRAKESESEVRVTAVDWVRFGQLLRDALGWETYPAHPEFPENREPPED